MRRYLILASIAFLLPSAAMAQATPPADAAATDPVTLGWMVGSPPPEAKQIRFANGSYFTFPKTRWSFSNWRQYFATAGIGRSANADLLPRALRKDIDAVSFVPIGGTAPVTWADSLGMNYTDGIVVLHKGSVVYERYFGVLKPDSQHIAFSVTKSFIGTLAAMLAAEGKLDPSSSVASIIPELKSSGFGDATVRQVMDMTTGLAFDETYTSANADIWNHARAGGLVPRPADYSGPEGFRAYLATVGKAGEHGTQFKYRTVNTDTLGWIVERVSGEKIPSLLQRRFWSKLGMEQDASIQVDGIGTAFAGGGLMPSLRDMARFGEMMRNGGKYRGVVIVPAAAVADIVRGASPEDFAKAEYKTLPGWSYRNQWWVSHNEHGAYMARGIHGQAIYIDPKAEMVIARFASHPVAGNTAIDPYSLPAYHALAKHLMASRR